MPRGRSARRGMAPLATPVHADCHPVHRDRIMTIRELSSLLAVVIGMLLVLAA